MPAAVDDDVEGCCCCCDEEDEEDGGSADGIEEVDDSSRPASMDASKVVCTLSMGERGVGSFWDLVGSVEEDIFFCMKVGGFWFLLYIYVCTMRRMKGSEMVLYSGFISPSDIKMMYVFVFVRLEA